MFRRVCCRIITAMARSYRVALARRVRLVQAVIKGYLVCKRVKQEKHAILQHKSATLVQRYLRGVLAELRVEGHRCEVGAAIAIQAWFKGTLVRDQMAHMRKAVKIKKQRVKEHRDMIEKVR
jgi:hypothetical protein